jgi:hypothetical protein
VFQNSQKKLVYGALADGTESVSIHSAGRGIVRIRLTPGFAASIFLCSLFGSATSPASAITAEVAKRCGALTAKQFPLRERGNPAAGSAKGSGKDQRAFFNKCVANGGKVEDGSTEK